MWFAYISFILWAFSGFGQVHEYLRWNANYKSYKTMHWPLHFTEDVLSTSAFFEHTAEKKTTVTGQTIHSPWFIWNHCKRNPTPISSCVSEFSGYTKPISSLNLIKLQTNALSWNRSVCLCVNIADGKLFNQHAIWFRNT